VELQVPVDQREHARTHRASERARDRGAGGRGGGAGRGRGEGRRVFEVGVGVNGMYDRMGDYRFTKP
jgi:hypothetical protein